MRGISRFPFPEAVEISGNGNGKRRRSGLEELVSGWGLVDAALVGELGEGFAQGGGAHAAGGAEAAQGQWDGGVVEYLQDRVGRGLGCDLRSRWAWVDAVDDFEREAGAVGAQGEELTGGGGGGAVFDRQGEGIVDAA